MATPILRTVSPGALLVGALCDEVGTKEDSSPREDVKTQLFFAPDRMWLPRGEESSAAQHGALDSGTRERAVEILGSIVVEFPNGLGARIRGAPDEEPTPVETSERPTSLFFAPDHMWMPADRRMQHEQLRQHQSAAEAPCLPEAVPALEQGQTLKAMISPGIEALRQAAAELSVAAAAAIKEASSAESSVENFVTAENSSDDEHQGGQQITEILRAMTWGPGGDVRKLSLSSEIERNSDEVPVGIGLGEARDEIRKSAWEGVSAFDHEFVEASPGPRSRKATPPRVHFSFELDDDQSPSASSSQHIRSAVQRATETLTDKKEYGCNDDAKDVEFASAKIEAERHVHGKYEAKHQQAACSRNFGSNTPKCLSWSASTTTGHVHVLSTITVPEWARGVTSKYFQRRAEVEACALQKALRRKEKLESLEAHPPEHSLKSSLVTQSSPISHRATTPMSSGSKMSTRSPPLSQSPPVTTLHPAPSLLLRTERHISSQNSPPNTFVSPPYFNFLRRSSPSPGADPNAPIRTPLHDFFPDPCTIARQSVSPTGATWLIDPNSLEGLSPERSLIAAAAPVGIGAGSSDYPGVPSALILPLEVTPTVGDRIKNCFCAFDISTPRALYESEVPNDLPAAPESKRASSSPLWDTYTPLENGTDENWPQQRPCPCLNVRENQSEREAQIENKQDVVTPAHNRSNFTDRTPDFSVLRRATATGEMPESQLRRASVRDVVAELGMVNDRLAQPAICHIDSLTVTRDSDNVDDFVYSTFLRLRAQSVEPVSPPDGLMGRERDHEGSSDVENDHGGPTGRQPLVQFSRRSSPATSPDKSPGTMSAVSTGSGQTATPRTSPPAVVKWWHWECAGCDSKFCSKMLYDEHLLECPRASLGYHCATDNNHTSLQMPSAADDSLSMNSTDPTLTRLPSDSEPNAANDLDTVKPCHSLLTCDKRKEWARKSATASDGCGPDVKLDDETDQGIALIKFPGAQTQDCSGTRRSLAGPERHKYSSLLPSSSATDNSPRQQGHGTFSQSPDYSGLDRSERLRVPALTPEMQEAQQLRLAQECTRELAKEYINCLDFEGRKMSAACELDTMSDQQEVNVTCGQQSSHVAHGQRLTTENISRSIFEISEDDLNVQGCVPLLVWCDLGNAGARTYSHKYCNLQRAARALVMLQHLLASINPCEMG